MVRILDRRAAAPITFDFGQTLMAKIGRDDDQALARGVPRQGETVLTLVAIGDRETVADGTG
jgi:hypothetical protein